jgi:hypothetical protein
MTSGNDPYLDHLRGQLSTVLDDVTPPAAPTAAVKRRGKAIKNRRRAGVALGLGVAVVAAALVPGLLRQSKAPGPVTPQNKHPKVTVRTVGRAPRGVIAEGAIDGKPWRITVRWRYKGLCVVSSGNLPQNGCSSPRDYATAWPATLNGSGGGSTESLYGIAARQVKRISIELSDGAVLNLHPVRIAGRDWIGLELPSKLSVTRLVAYSRTGELAYAIPFNAARGALPSVQAWLRPGEAAPRPFARVIGSGLSAGKRWSVTIHVGPWGQCAVPAIPGDERNVGCWTAASRQPGLVMGSGGPGYFPWWAIGVVRPHVSYLLLSMTDGSTRRVPVVRIGKVPYYVIVIFHRPLIARWAAYDASGHRLYGGQGAPSFPHT